MSKADLVDVNKDYSVTEVAELAGLDPSYIRRLLLQGDDLKGRKVHSRLWLISGREVKRWLAVRAGGSGE